MIDVQSALLHLKKDEKLHAHIRRLEVPTFTRRGARGQPVDAFAALAESIIYQQLSGKAAATIHRRFLELYKGKKHPTPKEVAKTLLATFRRAGVSKQKASYLVDLSKKFLDGTIDPSNFNHMSDEEIREHLVAVKGIGRWTADMFLIFFLHRPDVFPTGDLGIQKGFQKLHGMRALPKAAHMERLSRPWSPWRSVASRYLWLIQDTLAKDEKKSK